MRYSVLALVLLLTACTDSTLTDEPRTTSRPTSITITPSVTAPQPPTSSPPTTTTATTPPPVDTVVDSDPAFTALPVPNEELPHTFSDALVGDSGLLYVGAVSPSDRDHPNVTAFWHYDGNTRQRRLLADLLPPSDNVDYGQATNLVMWHGEYIGFVTMEPQR